MSKEQKSIAELQKEFLRWSTSQEAPPVRGIRNMIEYYRGKYKMTEQQVWENVVELINSGAIPIKKKEEENKKKKEKKKYGKEI